MTRLTVGDLELAVRRSRRRKTVQITVDRGGELVIAAPEDCPREAMERFVVEKRFWIYTKLAEKALHDQPIAGKRFVAGESFPYLGRGYRLLWVDEQDTPLKLERGRFKLRRADVPAAREHFVRWYREHARPWLARRASRWAPRFEVAVGEVRVLDLGFRWGSCGKGGAVNFHWAVILLPPRIIDYVIVHELVHLREPHHTPEFWRRVERAMPDYERRKEWLARRGGSQLAL